MSNALLLNWVFTLSGLLLSLGFCAYAGYVSGQPYNIEKPRRLPWRLFVVLSGFIAVLFVVHMINLLGYETGVDKGLLGRR